MWLTKRILVATDFTESSQAAADMGLELAKTFRVPLVLVHAYLVPETTIYSGVPMAPAQDYVRLVETLAIESLEKERARLAAGGTEVVAELRPGLAWEQILSTAQQLDADLIILGTHGRRGLPRAILGSVAEKVVRLSPIPVLTVHARSDAAAPGTS
jgi:nucleotide-binding universal stress UspA family protein